MSNEENFMRENLIIFKKYKITKKLAEGAFGNIYKGICIETNELVAIKIEQKNKGKPLLETEAYFLYSLKGLGIPEVLSFGRVKNYNVLVEPLLDKSLFDIFNENRKRMTLEDICLIANQIIDRIQWVHSKNIVHRDIKPDNFLIGRKDPNIVYLIDFGLSKKYKSSTTGKHIRFGFTGKLTGTVRFASANALRGGEQSRKDDLESIGYMLIFFMRGKLPWQGVTGKKKIERYLKIYKMKKNVAPEDLCKSLPKQMTEYMRYIKHLEFQQDPDYKYLRNLFNSLLKRIHNSDDLLLFSWIKLSDIRNLKNPINPSTRRDSPQNRLYRKIETKLKYERNLSSDNDSNQKLYQISNVNINNKNNTDIKNGYEDIEEPEIEFRSKKDKYKEGLNTMATNFNNTIDENIVDFEDDDNNKFQNDYESVNIKNNMKKNIYFNKQKNNTVNENLDFRSEKKFRQNQPSFSSLSKIANLNKEKITEENIEIKDDKKENNLELIQKKEKIEKENLVENNNNLKHLEKNNILNINNQENNNERKENDVKNNNIIENKEINVIKKEKEIDNYLMNQMDNIDNYLINENENNLNKKKSDIFEPNFEETKKNDNNNIGKINNLLIINSYNNNFIENKNGDIKINNQTNKNKNVKSNEIINMQIKEVERNNIINHKKENKYKNIRFNKDGPYDNRKQKKNFKKIKINGKNNIIMNNSAKNFNHSNNNIKKINEGLKLIIENKNININKKKKDEIYNEKINTFYNENKNIFLNSDFFPHNSDEIKTKKINNDLFNNTEIGNINLINIKQNFNLDKNNFNEKRNKKKISNSVNVFQNNAIFNDNMNNIIQNNKKDLNNSIKKEKSPYLINNLEKSNININNNIEFNNNRKIRIVNRNRNQKRNNTSLNYMNNNALINKTNEMDNNEFIIKNSQEKLILNKRKSYNIYNMSNMNNINNNINLGINMNINNNINNNIIINNNNNNIYKHPENSLIRYNKSNNYQGIDTNNFMISKRGSHNINISNIHSFNNLNPINQIEINKRPSYNIKQNNYINYNQIILNKRPSYNPNYNSSNFLNNQQNLIGHNTVVKKLDNHTIKKNSLSSRIHNNIGINDINKIKQSYRLNQLIPKNIVKQNNNNTQDNLIYINKNLINQIKLENKDMNFGENKEFIKSGKIPNFFDNHNLINNTKVIFNNKFQNQLKEESNNFKNEIPLDEY